MFREKFSALILVAALAGVGYMIVASATDSASIVNGLLRIGWASIALVLALSVFNYALRYWRWRAYLRALGHDVPETTHIAIYIAGFAFTPTPGKSGEAVRSLYLLPHGVSATESVGVLIGERVLDLWAVSILSVMLLGSWRTAAGLLAISIALASTLGTPYIQVLMLKLAGVFARLLPRRLAEKFKSMERLQKVGAILTRPRLLVFGMSTGFLAWLAEAVGLYVLVAALDSAIDPVLVIGIYGWSILLGAISFLPGGLGSTEAAMGFFLKLHGLSLDQAFVATLLCRLATLWFAVALGLIAVLWLIRYQRATPKAMVP